MPNQKTNAVLSYLQHQELAAMNSHDNSRELSCYQGILLLRMVNGEQDKFSVSSILEME